MNGALVVNVEDVQLGVVVVGVLLGDGPGPGDIVVLEVLVGGFVGGVVDLPVEYRLGDEGGPQLEQDEADDRDPDHQLQQPVGDHALSTPPAERLRSWRVKTASSSTPRIRAIPAKVTTPARTEARTRAARARPRSSLMPMETSATAAAMTAVATAIRATTEAVPGSARPPVRRRRSQPATAAATT